MKYHAILIASLALTLCALNQGNVASAAPAPAVSFDGTADFLKEMRAAMSIGANDEIVKLVRRHQQEAVWATIELCDANSSNPSERLEGEINALRIAWNKAMKTGFVEKTYEYYSLMDSSTRADRAKAVNRYQAFLAQLLKAEADTDKDTILKLGADFRGVADDLDRTGDHYHAGMAWLCYARTQDEANRGEDANLDEAAKAYKKVVEHLGAIELKDETYNGSKIRLQALTGMGFGPDAGGVGPDGKKVVPIGPIMPVGEPFMVPLTFRAEKEIDAIQRPIWSNDEVYNAWTNLYFAKEGATAKLAAVEGATLERIGPTSFAMISGENRTESTMNGKFVTVEVMLKGPQGDYPWAFLAVTGTRQDTFQGVTVNMEPAEENLTVYVAPAAVMSGVVGETPIEIYDDTMSGIWGDEPRSWAYVGMSPGHYQWDMDSVAIDGSKRALPWSKLQKIDDEWYELTVEGSQLKVQPMSVKTGTLELKFKGPKPRFLIVRGADNLMENYFDLTSEKVVEVPIGKYDLFFGEITKGKRDGIKKVIVLPGLDSPSYKVEEGKKTEVTLGGPFGFDFEFEDTGETVKILGASVVVTGIAGERYERPWNARPYPEVSVRKPGSKRGTKPQRMISNLDQDTLYSDWGLGFHPQDLELPKPKGTTGFEVQMIEKKNALFGALSSAWKAAGPAE